MRLVRIVAWILGLSFFASTAHAQITIDDHLRHARIMLATISPDGSTAAYLAVRANPIEDAYDATLRTVDSRGKSAPVTLAEFPLPPSEAFETDGGSFRLSGADFQWVSDDSLLFTRRVAGKAQLELWNRGDGSFGTVMSGHDRIALETEPVTGKIIVITTDFVPAPESRERPADHSLRMLDGYRFRFYGSMENPKEGRRLRTQRWTLSLDGNPATTPQGEPSEDWESKPEEFMLPPPGGWPGAVEVSATERAFRYALKKSPDGALTVATEHASPTVRGAGLSSVGLALQEDGAWHTLVPRDPSLISISVIGWRSDSKAVFYIATGPQGTSINSVSIDGKIRILHSEPAEIEMPYGSYWRETRPISRDGRTVLMVRSTNLTPDELVKVDLQSGAVTRLAAPNAAFAQRANAIVRFYPIPAVGPQVWGRLYLPRSAGRQHPLPLLIVQYYSTPGYEAGVGDEIPVLPLVDAGVAVFAMHSGNLNSGSTEGDFRMQMDRLDRPLKGMETIVRQLADDGLIDPHRIGLWGLSYGAEITVYAAWKSRLFKAVGVATTSWDPSHVAFGGPNWMKFFTERLGFPPLDAKGLETWRNYSLGLNIRPDLPPLLIQSGDREQNITVPTWTRLRAAGAKVEWFEYPDEGHLKRGPANKWWVFQRNLDWFRFWLQGYENPDPAKAEQYARWRKLRDQRDQLKLDGTSKRPISRP